MNGVNADQLITTPSWDRVADGDRDHFLRENTTGHKPPNRLPFVLISRCALLGTNTTRGVGQPADSSW
jgi:hypothetical protein